MTHSSEISSQALEAAYSQLSKLASAEYGQSLAELISSDEPVHGDEFDNFQLRDSQDAFWRLGRLIGITVKEPFATAAPRADQASQTGARRVWDLNSERLSVEHPDWWQYNLIAAFLADTNHSQGFDWLPPREAPEADQVSWFLMDAHSERGVFGALAKAARPYLCKDPKVRDELENVLPRGRIEADPLQMVAGGAATSGAGLIVAAVPWLGPRRCRSSPASSCSSQQTASMRSARGLCPHRPVMWLRPEPGRGKRP